MVAGLAGVSDDVRDEDNVVGDRHERANRSAASQNSYKIIIVLIDYHLDIERSV